MIETQKRDHSQSRKNVGFVLWLKASKAVVVNRYLRRNPKLQQAGSRDFSRNDFQSYLNRC